VDEVSNGEGGAHFVEFYRRAARLLCCSHRVLKEWKVWLTKSVVRVASQERIDTLLITLVDQS